MKLTLPVGVVRLLLGKYTAFPSKVIALRGTRGMVKRDEPADAGRIAAGAASCEFVDEVDAEGSFNRGGSSCEREGRDSSCR
jgi:hypothetical protein